MTDGPQQPEVVMGDRTHILPPGYGSYGLENTPPDIDDLPADFDPTSEDQLRGLSSGQIADEVASLHEIYEGTAGFSDDVVEVLLNPHPYPEADPEDVAVKRAILRELVRRTVQLPGWNLTREYLFPEDQAGAQEDGK